MSRYIADYKVSNGFYIGFLFWWFWIGWRGYFTRFPTCFPNFSWHGWWCYKDRFKYRATFILVGFDGLSIQEPLYVEVEYWANISNKAAFISLLKYLLPLYRLVLVLVLVICASVYSILCRPMAKINSCGDHARESTMHRTTESCINRPLNCMDSQGIWTPKAVDRSWQRE